VLLSRFDIFRFLFAAWLVMITAQPLRAGDRLLFGTKQRDDSRATENKVQHHSLRQARGPGIKLPLDRKSPWSLPTKALAEPLDTIDILVMRFSFQKEETDDPNTTGQGEFDLSRPLASPNDSAAYYDRVGHWIDPPPHDSLYFDAHLRALKIYWETVSEGLITLNWDIWPPSPGSAYRLPERMSEYGICGADLPADEQFDTVIFGLVRYFADCFYVADSVSPEIRFGEYDSYFLFHAGSDRQNDIGFPPTCSDLFTGYVNFIPDSVYFDTLRVDNDSTTIWNALILPETTNQDNRATAMNAVLAHEFGHQLGLPDLYRTDFFITNLGDFALMDHNGFNTSIDFLGFKAGGAFGVIPVYPCAWSRAYLGLVEVVDFRAGEDIYLAAAEIASDATKIARIPISENEYYLIEVRVDDLYPDIVTGMLADSATGVILYPVDTATREFTGEYDFLLPGSGMLIYHVDEGVAGLNYDWFTGDTVVNFNDNKLQLVPSRRFIRLMEADGIVDMSGYYETGKRRFGSADDMFRDDRQRSFTPNTNPAAVDNSGNDTHVRIERIGRLRPPLPSLRIDTAMTFDLETDGLVDGFPVRAGYPVVGLSPIVDDLNRDGVDEIIFASGRNLLAATLDGRNFIHQVSACDPCSTYYDTSFASVYDSTGRPHPLPLFARTTNDIWAGPVTGDFGLGLPEKFVAVGYPAGTAGWVAIYRPFDGNHNGLADAAIPSMPNFSTSGAPIALSFGDRLWVLTSNGSIYLKEDLSPTVRQLYDFDEEVYHGICRLDEHLLLLAGDSLSGGAEQTHLWFLSNIDSVAYTLDGFYNLGPILGDADRDGISEVAVFSHDGRAALITVDMSLIAPPNALPVFHLSEAKETEYTFTTNPVAGDLDLDGYPDIVIAGANAVYAFNRELTLLTGYPIEIDDRLQYDDVTFTGYYEDLAIAAPVIGDISKGGRPEIVFPTFAGNIYSFGPDLSYGFPLSAGERGAGSSLLFADSSGAGRLAYLGADGWFYAWQVDIDTVHDYWPMGGHDAAGSFVFDASNLGAPKQFSDLFPEERFYNYPNPVVDGATTIRYFLGREASKVELVIYDLSGRQVARFDGPTSGGVDNEKTWLCGEATPGVYRCMIEVDFGGETKTAFTDIAVIR